MKFMAYFKAAFTFLLLCSSLTKQDLNVVIAVDLDFNGSTVLLAPEEEFNHLPLVSAFVVAFSST